MKRLSLAIIIFILLISMIGVYGIGNCSTDTDCTYFGTYWFCESGDCMASQETSPQGQIFQCTTDSDCKKYDEGGLVNLCDKGECYKDCKENCGNWGSCQENGIQIRSCSRSGYCTDNLSFKENRTCIYQGSTNSQQTKTNLVNEQSTSNIPQRSTNVPPNKNTNLPLIGWYDSNSMYHKLDISLAIIIFILWIIFILGVLYLLQYLGIVKFKISKNQLNKKEPIKEEIITKVETKIAKVVEEVKEKLISDTPISIKNLTVKNGKSLILNNINLDIKKEEFVCLLGPSGTGKSTIIEALVGRKIPTEGIIKIFDKNIKDKKVYQHVGFVPQHPEVYLNQTVKENLNSSAIKWGIKNGNQKIERIMSIINLNERKDLKANKLSGGQLKLLSLGMELIRDPELLILDEPTTGLDPNTRGNIITILSRLVTQENKTVFFTTHYMDDAEECDDVIILSKTKIVTQGSPSKLEKRLPGSGKVVYVVLDNITEDLLKKIEKIEDVEKVISEGRNLKIITNNPNAIKLAHKIDELGGIVNKTEIADATMKEVFIYHTGEKLKE